MSADASLSQQCPRCRGSLTPGAVGGLCPRCLIGLALGRADDTPATAHAAGAPTTGAGALGVVIGAYLLVEELARGGVGIVYRARHRELGREIALKMLLPARLLAPEAIARFQREAQAMARLDHPGILPVYEVGEDGGLPYFAMKLATGGSLAQRIGDYRGRWCDIALLVADIADAIAVAHGQGIVHRDIKPANVLFDSDGRPMVSDFGLARSLDADSSLTAPESVLGTPRYLAPEAAAGVRGALALATDVYSLGALLYELLCGQPPWADLSAAQILQRLPREAPESPRRIEPSVPPALECVCQWAMARRPEERPPSAQALAQVLRRYPKGRVIRLPRLASKLRRVRIVALVAALGMLGVLGWLFAAKRPEPPTESVANAVQALPAVSAALLSRVAAVPSGEGASGAAARALATRLAVSLTQRLGARGQGGVEVLGPVDTTAASAGGSAPVSALERALGLSSLRTLDVSVTAGRARIDLVDHLRRERLRIETAEDDAGEATVERLAEKVIAWVRAESTSDRLSSEALTAIVAGMRDFERNDEQASERAARAFDRAIELAPRSAVARAWLSLTYAHRHLHFRRGMHWLDSATYEAETAAQLDPALAGAYEALGFAHYRKGWLARSVEALERAVALGSTPASGGLALNYYAMGRFDDAMEAYLRVLDTEQPGTMDPYFPAGVLYTIGDVEAGQTFMRAAIAREPQADRRAFLEAIIEYYRGDCPSALASIRDVPGATAGWFFNSTELRLHCATLGQDWPAALREIEIDRTTPLRPTRSDRRYAQNAVLLDRLGRREESRAMIDVVMQATAADRDAGGDYFGIPLYQATVYRLRGRTDDAYRLLDEAIALGFTLNARNAAAPELLPFADDERYSALRADFEGRLARMRQRCRALVAAAGGVEALVPAYASTL